MAKSRGDGRRETPQSYQWQQHHQRLGAIVRYADDLVILCFTAQAAEAALQQLKGILATLGLQVHPEKTRIRCLRKGQEGFDFLGFHHCKKESWRRKGSYYLHRWPSQKAKHAIYQKIKTIVGAPSQRRHPVSEVIRTVTT